MDVRRCADRADWFSFDDLDTSCDEDRTELEVRDGQTV
jgi:hypothetical protein